MSKNKLEVLDRNRTLINKICFFVSYYTKGLIFELLFFQHAKERVYGCKKLQQKQAKKRKTEKSKEDDEEGGESDDEGN